MALDRSKQLAVEALTEKLKAMIEERVEKADSRGSCRASWNVMEELKTHEHWKGDTFGESDRRQADSILASYKAEIARMKAAEAEVWKAIADLLKS